MSVRGAALRDAMGRVGSGEIDLNANAPEALGLGSQCVLLAQLRRARVYVHFVIETAHRCQAEGLSPTGRRSAVAKGPALPCVLLHEHTLLFKFF